MAWPRPLLGLVPTGAAAAGIGQGIFLPSEWRIQIFAALLGSPAQSRCCWGALLVTWSAL